MVRANLGRGLVILAGVVLVIVAIVALNLPDHKTANGRPSVSAAVKADGGASN